MASSSIESYFFRVIPKLPPKGPRKKLPDWQTAFRLYVPIVFSDSYKACPTLESFKECPTFKSLLIDSKDAYDILVRAYKQYLVTEDLSLFFKETTSLEQ
jgi:hypothetical protein